MKYTKEQFVSVLCDCKGYGEDEAVDYYEEYNGDLEAVVKDMGCDEVGIQKMRVFLNI
ncbi:MAG: hypothetical protein WC554_09845 [Clostridia bacterium]